MTNIYIYDITNFNISLEEIEKKIPVNCRKYPLKYKSIEAKKLSLISWYVLCEKLKIDYNIDIENTQFKENEFGKPECIKKFNISHSLNMIVVGISDLEIGLDIEVFDEERDFKKIAKKITLNDSIFDNDYDIIKLWTQKEAYYKYFGTGIIYDRLSDNIDMDLIKTFEVFDSQKNLYYLSIATKSEKININRIGGIYL